MKIKKTIQTFESGVYNTYYLDELENGDFIITQDEFIKDAFHTFKEAEKEFKRLARLANSTIEYH